MTRWGHSEANINDSGNAGVFLGSLRLVARQTETFMKKLLILRKIHQPLNTK